MSSTSSSLLEVQFARDSFEIDLRLEWHAQSLILFGPSGSGKTTLLRILLGLEPDAHARIRLSGTWLEDPDNKLNQPTHQRRLGWVPQSPTLFPDRSVDSNIRFGARDPIEREWIDRAIEVLELGSILDRSVAGLSGGESQRVALARAIAIRPRALLLDEPMASLDVALRARILPYLMRIRDELDLPLIYITHDPDEAILLGDEIAVLDRGKLIAQGAPRETLWSQAVHSLSAHVNVENILEARCIATEGSSVHAITVAGLKFETPWPMAAGEDLTIGIRAEEILISLDHPHRISARNVYCGSVTQLDSQSDHCLVHVDVEGEPLISRLTLSAVKELSLSQGTTVYLIMKSQALRRIR